MIFKEKMQQKNGLTAINFLKSKCNEKSFYAIYWNGLVMQDGVLSNAKWKMVMQNEKW